MQEELCLLAEQLQLKPIQGLTLENRKKKSRRRAKIEIAATIRIQTVARMFLGLVCLNKLKQKFRAKRQNLAATVIIKFFKYVLKRAAIGGITAAQTEQKIIMIQTHFRMFLAKQRFFFLILTYKLYYILYIFTE